MSAKAVVAEGDEFGDLLDIVRAELGSEVER